jgi:hypothetical protein
MIDRREFMKSLLAAGAGGIAALSLGAPGCSSAGAPAAAPRVSRTHAPPAALPKATLDMLLAAAEGLTGVRPLRGHYARYFEYRAVNMTGYAALYEAFAAEVHRLDPGFLAAGLDARLEVLDRIRYRSPKGELSPPGRDEDLDMPRAPTATSLPAGLPEAALRAIRFERYVLQEILTVFAKTDAWLALGYRSWRFSPRGLEEHLHPPT